jgi:predicted nucleotidyltransferase
MRGIAYDTEIMRSVVFTPAEKSILKTLAYFDIFHYPLTKKEIGQFLDTGMAAGDLNESLTSLLTNGIIFFHNDFYALQNNPFWGYRRKKGNEKAKNLLKKANKIGRFLYRFPFVRAVAVSGSLSKNFADEKADIDFFIITKSNRLWIARTLMHLFKKLTFLTRNQDLYCMNFYISDESLQINDQNIFTATEIKTLLPVCGIETIMRFNAANQWASDWLPNYDFRKQQEKEPGIMLFKRAGEWLFDNRLGEYIDNKLMQITRRRWERKKEKGMQNKKGLVMGLMVGKDFARSNPGAFQEKVLAMYEEKLCFLRINDNV